MTASVTSIKKWHHIKVGFTLFSVHAHPLQPLPPPQSSSWGSASCLSSYLQQAPQRDFLQTSWQLAVNKRLSLRAEEGEDSGCMHVCVFVTAYYENVIEGKS